NAGGENLPSYLFREPRPRLSMPSHEAVARLDDGLLAAMVGTKQCLGSVVQGCSEVAEKVRLRPGEAVDGLPVIADAKEAQSRIVPAYGLVEMVKAERKVLILVDQHPA